MMMMMTMTLTMTIAIMMLLFADNNDITMMLRVTRRWIAIDPVALLSAWLLDRQNYGQCVLPVHPDLIGYPCSYQYIERVYVWLTSLPIKAWLFLYCMSRKCVIGLIEKFENWPNFYHWIVLWMLPSFFSTSISNIK